MSKRPRIEQNDDPPLQSMLERHPDHVKAIGMISVEMANLEVMLAGLLGALLNLPQHIADAIYFSPQAIGPRIAILANAAKIILPAAPLKDIDKILGKVRELQQKRNDHIHNAWGLSVTTGEVTSSKLPITGEGTPVPLTELVEQLDRLRKLITSVHEISPAIHEVLWTQQSSQQISSEPDRPKTSQPSELPKSSSTRPKRRARRKPSTE